MARRFRLFGKKRGDRRSLPRWMGTAGEIAFYAVLLVSGSVAFGYILVDYLLPEWWANRNFEQTTCQVLATSVERREIDGVSRYRPQVQITYETDGKVRGPTWTYDVRNDFEYDRESAQEIADSFKQSEHYACWYNPINPALVVVARDVRLWSWLLLLLPASVAIFGGYKLVRTALTASHSLERRIHAETVPAGVGQTSGRARRAAGTPAPFPAVPAISDIVNSPGTHLAYRLPGDSTPGWRVGGLTAMAVLFGGVLVALASHAAASSVSRSNGIGELLFLVPLLVVEVGLVRAAALELLRFARCGSSRLEVSAHPLLPGGAYELMLVQTGKMKIRRLEVQLICQEEATFSPGTDIRVAREIVYRDVLMRRDFLEIGPAAALEAACELRIPEGAMHSFVAEHNRVDWYILVRVRSASCGFDRRFPVCVYPRVSSALFGQARLTSAAS
jgi:hypothetical protein